MTEREITAARGREPRSFVIEDDFGDKHEWSIVAFPGDVAIDLETEIAQFVAEGFKTWGGGGMSSGLKGIAELLQRKGGATYCKRLLEHATRDGQPIGYDTSSGQAGEVADAVFAEAFQANVGELHEAVYRVLEVNYGGFFSRRLRGFFEGQFPRLLGAALKFAEPLESIGQSGTSSPTATAPSAISGATGATET